MVAERVMSPLAKGDADPEAVAGPEMRLSADCNTAVPWLAAADWLIEAACAAEDSKDAGVMPESVAAAGTGLLVDCAAVMVTKGVAMVAIESVVSLRFGLLVGSTAAVARVAVSPVAVS